MTDTNSAIAVKDLHKRFGSLDVLKGVSLEASSGDVVAIIGGSGSGKSTLLRCINLLEIPSSGSIAIHGEQIRMRTRGNALEPADTRQVQRIRASLGMVFQNFSLWQHMSVLENIIEAPIHVLGVRKEQAIAEAEVILRRVGLYEKRDVYLFGLLIGVCGAAGKLYGGPVVRDLLAVYTTVVRGIPELVLLLILYYAGTQFLNTIMGKLGYGSVDISGLVAGIVVIGLVQGAYATEVMRGAILSIAPGQIEAGRAFGMSPVKVMRRITVPAMLPFAIPGLSNLWLIATKDTALLAVVGFTELTLVTRQAAGATKAYLLFFLTAGAIYLGITLLSTTFLRALERYFKRGFPEAR